MFDENVPLCITDIETGGLDLTHPIIQIAAIAVNPKTGSILEEFNEKIQFDQSKCSPEALEINHYKPEDWITAKPERDVLRKLSEFYKGYAQSSRVSRKGGTYKVAIGGGYNSHFDTDRIFHKSRAHALFQPVDPRFLDVMQLAMWKLKLASYKLTSVADHLGIKYDNAHDALVDVKLTFQVMQALR